MFYILVVLYKKTLNQSDTLQGILKSANILANTAGLLYVWDNSPTASLTTEDIETLQHNFDLKYFHCPDNKPFSFIYNSAIEEINRSDKYKYLILFDDDSKISSTYFQELLQITHEHKEADIILPQAINSGRIISPARLFFVQGKYFDRAPTGIYRGKLLAVNSGMVISANFLKKYFFRYDDKLMNYGTDNYLMNFANKKKAVYYIMRSTFEHGYSFYDTDDLNKKIMIFKQIKQANKIAFSMTPVQSALIRLYNFLSSLKNTIKYKSIKFFS